jgi:hypothetical protein
MPSRPRAGEKIHSARTYRFGFSLVGFIAVLVPILANIPWALLPPVSSALPANDSPLPFVDVVGVVSQSLMIALLILLINTRRRPTACKSVLAAVGVACLVGYLLLWVWYFTAPITPTLLLMMAVLPAAYFICVALYLENYPALIPAGLFALIHITTTTMSYF